MIRTRTLAPLALAVLLAFAGAARADDDGGAVPRDTEAAIDRGLSWLHGVQQRDGAWIGGTYSAATTGLATMAFMARGHVPGQGPYGETINRGVDAILSLQNADGVISQNSKSMYEHGICTVALCEAYGMLDDRRQALTRTAISKAVRVILNAQGVPKSSNDRGGWRYMPGSTDSDISVSGWQLMALRGASNAGASIPKTAIDDGIAYIKKRYVQGGGFAYTANDSANMARTGTGVLALSLMGQPETPEVKAGAVWMTQHLDRMASDGHYYYTVYYCSQAAWQIGGNTWRSVNDEISRDLKRKQGRDGAWAGGEGYGEAYATSMAVLALTVPYRYLPIYQR